VARDGNCFYFALEIIIGYDLNIAQRFTARLSRITAEINKKAYFSTLNIKLTLY
jgi:hypothetical protein